jgi:hypothetical protein
MTSDVAWSDSRLGLATAVRFEGDVLVVALSNGRDVSSAVADYPLLMAATAGQRANYEISPFGTSIHWPEVDEDIGVNYLLGVTEDELYDFAGFTRYS